MSAHQIPVPVWNDVLEKKSHLIINQISDLKIWAQSAGLADPVLEQMAAPYYKLLASIYEEDYPLARAIESSDLLLHYRGPAVDSHNPRLSLLADIFNNVRRQVGSVAYAISNISGRTVLPKDVDLGLSGFAKGSLFVGFSLPDPSEYDEDGERSILGAVDPLYLATKQAIRAIGVVSKMIGENAPNDEFSRQFPDSKIRDVAISAVRNLSPTGRIGITDVDLIGKEIDGHKAKSLTKDTRLTAKKLLDAPIQSIEITYFIGTIREIDLDVERFEIRHLAGSGVLDIRCKYPSRFETLAKDLLDKRVRVTGKIDRTPDGTPRLLEVQEMEAAD